MSDIKLNSKQFFEHARKLQSLFDDPLLILLGRTVDTQILGHNSALFLYLLQCEFPESAIILTNPVTFITSYKKSTILSQLDEKINIIVKEKEEDTKILSFLKDKKFTITDLKNIKGRFCELILNNIEYVERTNEINRFFTQKNEQQYDYLAKGMGVMGNVFGKGKEMIVNCIMNENYVGNRSVSTKIETIIDNISDTTNIDLIYLPIIQTRKYDLNLLESDSGTLNSNVLYRLGIRYSGYCNEKGRTLLFNADEETYNIYEKMFIQRDEIVKEIVKSIENVELNTYLSDLNAKGVIVHSSGILQNEGIDVVKDANDIYAFCIDLRQKHDNTLLTVCDTVLVKNGHAMYEKDSIHKYTFITHTISKKDTKSKQKEVEKNLQRHEHQKELMDALIEEMVELYKLEDAPRTEVKLEKKRYIPYLKETNVPRHEMLYVDRKNYALVVPMNNYVLPFSIEAIKNVSKTDDGVLRINFNMNGTEDSIKSISYKCGNDHAAEYLQRITEMKKEFNINNQTLNREVDTSLILISGRKIALPEVLIRTDNKQRKSKPNTLELHENGFRYNNDGTFIDILFDNIKHFFFQEGTIESRVLINFHLKEPMFLPKKTFNIQFYRECSTHAIQDTSKIKDEYMEAMLEKEDENRRRAANNEFSLFVDKVETSTPLRVEVPSRSGSFYGVPFKGSVLIQPTNECLVNLTEFPTFVLTLSEIEVACFERMVLGIKTFDLTFVHKDKQKPVVPVTSIDSGQANKVKDFLDGKNIPFIETKINLQWNALMKEIMKDPVSFYENGAWCELQPHREDEEAEDESEPVDLDDVSTTSSDTDMETSEGGDVESSSVVEESSAEEYEETEDESYASEEDSDLTYKKLKRK